MHGMMISKNLRYQSRNQTSRLRDCGTSRVVARRHCFRVRCSRDTPGAIRTVGIEQASVSKIRFEFAGTAGARWQTTAAMDETCSVRNISRNRISVHQSHAANTDTSFHQSFRQDMYVHMASWWPERLQRRNGTHLATDGP